MSVDICITLKNEIRRRCRRHRTYCRYAQFVKEKEKNL